MLCFGKIVLASAHLLYQCSGVGAAGAVVTPMLEARFAQLMATSPRIILGSASSSRRQIMDELMQPYKASYEVCTADIDEKAIRRPLPRDLVLDLAHAKAEAIKAKLRSNNDNFTGFLLTCDQVVVHEDRILEKPESEQEARGFIAGYSCSPPSTVGSVLCTCLSTGRTFQDVDTAYIHFTAIPDASVDQLMAEGDCLYCAGGLMVEHPLVVPHVVRIDGTQDSVMGLSKALVMKLLLQAADMLQE